MNTPLIFAPDFAARRARLRKLLKTEKVEGLLVTNFINVTYLTGFTGDDSYLLISADDEVLVTDLRYTTQLEDECPNLKLKVRKPGEQMTPTLVSVLEKSDFVKLGIESGSMTVGQYVDLQEKLPKIEFAPVKGLVEELRMCKDKFEIDATRLACVQARKAFEVVRAGLTPDTTEAQVAADLEYQVRKFGGKGLSFTPIVGVGARAALPHGRPTNKRLGEADFTLIDWGANSGLYVSDLTRVLVTGKPSARLEKIYNVVLEAQLAGIKAIKPGVKCEDVDAAARQVIERAGYGPQFGHGLGHGTGLDIHEAPRFAKGQETVLKPGMIVTVEPGIYFPGWGGVRIEDDVLVTKTGHEVLTDVPKLFEECLVR